MAVSWSSWLANEGVKHLCLVGWRARLAWRSVCLAASLIHSWSVHGLSLLRDGFATNLYIRSRVWLIWLSLNVLLFWKTFLLYNQGPEYYYIHQMLG
ncbi:hypothetical protein U0070_021201, partial [Myodes glareolus]